MKDIEFFSSGSYLFLPTLKNPKVALAVDDKHIAKNSFKLYNPFSKKAKILKTISYQLVKLLKFTPIVKRYEKSDFITQIKAKLNKEIISSVYYATDKDKVVLQIQSKDINQILGYMKVSLNEKGNEKIDNESYAIDILSTKGVLDSDYKILFDRYNERSYLYLKNLDGDISFCPENEVKNILKKFYRDEKYLLKDHPRVLNLQEKLMQNKEYDLLEVLNKTVNSSKNKYSLVYEHGDFAPWNIIKVNNSWKVFDVEYFEKDGLEYMDLIKYFYQQADLLYNHNEKDLIKTISIKIKKENFIEIFKIFLIKEIFFYIEEKKEIKKLKNLLELIVA